jgi:hypothetical protein
MAQKSSMLAVRICSGGMDASQPYAFARSICWRALKTIRSPASTSADTVHNRNATLRGSMRSAEPERKLADPMLFRMAGGAQRNGVAIAGLPPYTTIRSCPHVRRV